MNIPYKNRSQSPAVDERLHALIRETTTLANEAILVATSQYPEFMTVDQVADALQMSHNTVRSLLNQHKIPGKKLGQKWIIPREALAKALIKA